MCRLSGEEEEGVQRLSAGCEWRPVSRCVSKDEDEGPSVPLQVQQWCLGPSPRALKVLASLPPGGHRHGVCPPRPAAARLPRPPVS